VALPAHERRNGNERVQSLCAGDPVWFESGDASLAPVPEAFLGPFLLPALDRHSSLASDAELDPVWLDGVRRLTAIYAGWWGYPNECPVNGAVARVAGEPQGVTGACFTGGLDSFYTLLTGRDRIDALVFAHGYDIALEDTLRMAAFERSMREVAERMGKRAIVLRTNLREHPVFSESNWDRTHGAALAAMGHLLTGTLRALVVPSSYRLDRLIPWGSHPDTDSLWSTSRLAIVHDDHSVGREDKVARIVHEPIVWEHLRVCWEKRAPSGNCSSCVKCVRTMVAIDVHGRLGDFQVFNRGTSLERRLDDLPALPEHLIVSFSGLLRLPLAPPIRRSVERLIQRSGHGVRAKIARRVQRLRSGGRN
jgi:hypothetical protein